MDGTLSSQNSTLSKKVMPIVDVTSTNEKPWISIRQLTPEKACLKTAMSTPLILDLQDVAWYASQVHFKSPQVKSFFSQHDHFEYSQIAVKQDVQEEEEALVPGDY